MKLFMIRAAFSSFLLSTTGSAIAANETPAVKPPLYCANIEKACTAAGFRKFGHRIDNGLWKACMEPILNGKTVENVTIDPADVKGCQQIRAKKTTP